MGDIADILGLSGGGAAAGNGTPPAKPKKEDKQKPKAKINREVLLLQENINAGGLAMGLGGRSHVSVMPSSQLPMKKSLLQQRPALRNKWVRREFTNAARNDGLVLTHWVKSSIPEGLEYPFARFNVTCEVSACCTKDEYEKDLLTHQDPLIPTSWNFDDTVFLWDLCKRYELRWIVIADRFNSQVPSKQSRSIEDIKYWYYEVTRLLSERRNAKTEETAPVVPEATTATATTSSTETPKTEEAAVEPTVEAAKVSPDASQPPSFRYHIAYEKQRKAQLELQFNRSNAEESAIKKLQEELRNVEQQIKKAVLRVDMKKKKELAEARHQFTREVPTGVYFRSTSQALPTQKMGLSAKLSKKLSLMLDEFGIPARPMPTKAVCEGFDKVRQDILSLLALRKTLTSKVNEVHALADKYSQATGVSYTPRAKHQPLDPPIGGGVSEATPSATPLALTPATGSSKISQKGGSSIKRKIGGAAAAAASGKRPKKVA
ncbi:hypothetical protein LEN26_015904 [Aphanomyces euteiches]|nr:hypothetical protein LEN26_015904 [Aphanomyces euteiches]KAH9127399.1 hypothetical protein AeMF1_002298 [Aphanomyces euteiches]KAH9189808.1 hypothetical protein AeNC1_008221 [Aphanomyces euteiches]